MNIRQKMLLGAGLLTLIPVVITAALLSQGAASLTSDALSDRTREQLVVLRETKRVQITDEINNRMRALQTLAGQRSTVEAMRGFASAYATAAKDSGVTQDAAKAAMAQYAKAQFATEFAKRNIGTAPDLLKSTAALNPNGLVLQSEFIANNPSPLGQKDKFTKPPSNYIYAQTHAVYHPDLERSQKLLEYYDIFFIDTQTDNIVYTVFKELDFGSTLSGDGIAANTKLAEAYNKVKKATSRDTSFLSDFAPYLASYDDQAAFGAAPIFDGETQIGVLAMQYPIDKITDVMNSSKKWKAIGLGDTGDMFIVGADKLMRSNARYVAENKENFIAQMGAKLSSNASANLLKKESSVGLVTIDSDATRPALAGQDGFVQFTDYRGVDSYGAYGPLKVQGLNWGLVAKIDTEEANQTIGSLNRQSFIRALLIGLAVVSIAAVLVTFLLRKFLAPIQKLSDTVKQVASGNTSARTELKESDEIGDLGRSFDGLLDDRIASLERTVKENEAINDSVIALLQTVFELGNRNLTVRAPVTEDIIGTVSSSINQLSQETSNTLLDIRQIASQVLRASESVRAQAQVVDATAEQGEQSLRSMADTLTQATDQLLQVADLSKQSSLVAGQTSAATESALSTVGSTVAGMSALSTRMGEMEARFKQLAERTKEITTAVGLVNTLTERTNLLALSASTQAASAGEAGRGFMVVAQEVRRLSDSSQQATAQIAQLVTNIQGETNETLQVMSRLMANVKQQTLAAQKAGVDMQQTQATTGQLVQLVQRIAAFAQQQTQVSEQLQLDLATMRQGTRQTAQASAQQTTSADTLVDFSRRLTESVGQFKLTA